MNNPSISLYDAFLSHHAQDQPRVRRRCLSPNALASGWVALERSTAIHRGPANERRRFIPLPLADCDLPDTLRRSKVAGIRQEAVQ